MKHYLAILLSLLGITMLAGVEHPAAEWVSGTLPVLYITTEDSLQVTSKEYYLQGAYYLDPMGCEGVEAIGTPDEQLAIEIKGRGNGTWERVKKPYRIKLGEKAPLLGMRKNRHWCLLTEWSDGRGRLTWETGFYVSRALGMPWTPGHEPVELVLNGDYQGLYFLTEKIRVEKHRVGIVEQDDMETDPDLITGGWLCEIDNYVDSPQIILMDRTLRLPVRHTIHSPEVLSTEQKDYVTALIRSMDVAIFNKDKTSTAWEQIIDLDRLARFYLTNEILYEIECFGGSCFWSKDRGDSAKVCFGPVWDFDQACTDITDERFCYQNQTNTTRVGRNKWIHEIVKFPRFQQRVRELWQFYCDSVHASVEPHARQWVERVRAAHRQDVMRWYDALRSRLDIDARSKKFLARLDKHHNFLAEQWSLPVPVIGDANADGRVDITDIDLMADRLLGRPAEALDSLRANAYDDSALDLSDLVGIARQVWLAEHPGALLPYPELLPYGQSDKAIDRNITLTPLPARATGSGHLTVPIAVSGSIAFTALQAVAAIDGGSIVGATLAGCAHSHRLETQVLDGGALRVLMWSDSLSSLHCDTTQPVLWLDVVLDDSAVEHSLSLTSAMLAEADMFPHCLAAAKTTIDYSRNIADLNGDGILDIDDINLLVNILLGKSPSIPGADIDNNGVTDIEDLNLLVNLMLG